MRKLSKILILYELATLGLMITACGITAKKKTLIPSGARITTVAVMEFEDHSLGRTPGTQGLGRSISDRIAGILVQRRELLLISREYLQTILEELSLSTMGTTQKGRRLKLGQLLGADYLIMGGYTVLGTTLRIDARIIEVEKGVIEGTSAEGLLSERRVIEEALSKDITERIITKIGPGKETPTTSRDYYLRGLAYEQSNNRIEAMEHYKKAVSLNPDNQSARDRIEAILLKDLE